MSCRGRRISEGKRIDEAVRGGRETRSNYIVTRCFSHNDKHAIWVLSNANSEPETHSITYIVFMILDLPTL